MLGSHNLTKHNRLMIFYSIFGKCGVLGLADFQGVNRVDINSSYVVTLVTLLLIGWH